VSASVTLVLTAEQIDQYHSDGFLVMADFASADACDRLRARANEMVAAWEPGEERSVFTTNEQERVSNGEFLTSGSSTWCFFEEEAFDDTGSLRQAKELSINKIGHAQHDTDDEFRQFAYNPDLGAVARDLGMTDPRALQSMYIFKQPRIGGEVSVHQDATFLWTDPLSVIGFWFALEDATIDNGCLWAVPGTHRGPLRQLFKRNRLDDPAASDGTIFDELSDEPLPAPDSPDAVALEVKAGTMIALHGLLPHWSNPNRSALSRHAYSLHCIDGTADYPAWNWLQRPADMPLNAL
jgi:phytanoyl-CoA hydroxylase